MARLGASSEAALATCTPAVQRVVRLLVARLPAPYDVKVVWGHRGQADQDAAFKAGHSEKRWPHSKHNLSPSPAVDLIPFPVGYSDHVMAGFIAGFVVAILVELGWEKRYRWLGDANRNGATTDSKLGDHWHFEIYDHDIID